MISRERVIALSARIASLRQEVADAEAELDNVIGLKPAAENGNGSRMVSGSIPSQIIRTLESDPETPVSAPRVCALIGVANLGSVRGALNRLADDGKIERVGRGKFRAVRGK